ncbi:hypothetical protein B8W73_16360 [Arthrobacter agilis]|nr:hypothetical protein B8W73_16360 [Arthrobacter agilis]
MDGAGEHPAHGGGREVLGLGADHPHLRPRRHADQAGRRPRRRDAPELQGAGYGLLPLGVLCPQPDRSERQHRHRLAGHVLHGRTGRRDAQPVRHQPRRLDRQPVPHHADDDPPGHLAVRRTDGHLPGRTQGSTRGTVRGGVRRRSKGLAQVPQRDRTDALAGDLLQPAARDDQCVPGVRLGVHHRLRDRRPRRRHQLLHRLPLHTGLRQQPDGLRIRDGLGPAARRRRPRLHPVPHLQELGPLRRRLQVTTIESNPAVPVPVDPDGLTRPARRRRRRRPLRRHLPTALWVIGIVALTALVLYPLLWMVSASLKPNSEFGSNQGFFPENPTFDNFVKVMQGIAGIPTWKFFLNSLLLGIGAVIGTVISSSMAAYAFSRINFRGSKLLFAAMIGTLLLPFHVLIIPQYMIFRNLGLIDTFWPLLAGKFLATEAFFVFLMVQFIRNLPRELDEAARIDGCGHGRIFFSITLPLIKPALITSSIFAFIWSWNDFLGPLLYLNSPEKYPLPLALRIFNDQTSTSDYGATIAISVLALLPVMLFFILFQRFLVDGVATQGLKG